METSLILSQALKASIDCSILHQELLLLLKPLENKSIEDLLDMENDESLKKIDTKINAIFSQAQQNGCTDNLVQIINVARKYLREGVQQADIRAILISILLNCILNIRTVDLLGIFDVLVIEKACGAIITTLSKIKLDIHALPDVSFHEKEILKKAEDGFANNNIDDVYNVVTILEDSNRSLLYKLMPLHLIKLLHDLDFEIFINYLATLNSIFSIVFYLQEMYSTAEFLRVANEQSLTNKWLNFELIRQLIEKDDLKVMYDIGVLAICNTLSRIKKTDFEFFEQTIKYFHHRHPLNIEVFDAALGRLLSTCNSTEVFLIVEDAFEINRYEHNIKSRDALKDSYQKNSDVKSYLSFLQAVFKKWEGFWNDINGDKELHINELVYTDYANFVIEYHSLVTTDEYLLEMLQTLLDKICYIDSEWIGSKINQQSKFCLYMSELLLLSYAYRNKEITDDKMLSCARTILNNSLMEMRYKVSDFTKVRCHEIIQNIGWNKTNLSFG